MEEFIFSPSMVLLFNIIIVLIIIHYGNYIRKETIEQRKSFALLNYSYNGKRRKEYLGIILDAPTSAERRAENKNKILIARQIRAKKELEFLSVEYHLNDIENTFDDILPTDKSNVPDFYILIGQFLDTYHKRTRKWLGHVSPICDCLQERKAYL